MVVFFGDNFVVVVFVVDEFVVLVVVAVGAISLGVFEEEPFWLQFCCPKFG